MYTEDYLKSKGRILAEFYYCNKNPITELVKRTERKYYMNESELKLDGIIQFKRRIEALTNKCKEERK